MVFDGDRYACDEKVHLVPLWPQPFTSKLNQFTFAPQLHQICNFGEIPTSGL